MKSLHWLLILLGASAIIGVIYFDSPKTEPTGPMSAQGWRSSERLDWYTKSQGSRLLPLTWALALELPNSEEKVFTGENPARHNYIPFPPDLPQQQGLYVGFAIDAPQPGDREAGAVMFPRLAREGVLDTKWVGLNCSACHTNIIRHEGRSIWIDGSPTLADFEGFFSGMREGMRATLARREKFDRFATMVLGGSRNAHLDEQLRAQLMEWLAYEDALQAKNQSEIAAGFGRLDAQGHILNKVSLLAVWNLAGSSDPVSREALWPANAPASYPFIWNAGQHDKVQWNGLVKNLRVEGVAFDIGALARNVGEVTGVFAHVNVERERWLWGGYPSTIRVQELDELEQLLGKLKSPRWADAGLPPVVPQLVEDGGKIYKARCQSCHAILPADEAGIDRGEQQTPIVAEMLSLNKSGTDIWLACNTYLSATPSGAFEGRLAASSKPEDASGHSYKRAILENVVVNNLLGKKGAIIAQGAKAAFEYLRGIAAISRSVTYSLGRTYLPGVADERRREQARTCIEASELTEPEAKPELKQGDPKLTLAYKARPLNGIWATAPYLHNGSVPTLYDMLLPATLVNVSTAWGPSPGADSKSTCERAHASETIEPKFRPEIFTVGSREFDPVNVGFKCGEGDGPFVFRTRMPDGQPILGNYNSGHLYGTELQENERRALVEYLKTL